MPLFKNLREGCTVPIARKALDRILRDEVRHRAFGGRSSMDARNPSRALPPRGDRARAPGVVSSHSTELRARLRRAPRHYFLDVDRAWGLMAPARYGTVVERTWERDWKPRFAKLSIDAAPAWERAKAAP